MARTALTVTTLTPNTPLVGLGTTTNIDATNHHKITVPAGSTPRELLIIVKNTTASTKTATLKAGDNPPSLKAGQGDMSSVSLTDGSTTPTYGVIGPIDPSRYTQSDGTIELDVASGMTGTITVLAIPRTV